LARDLAPNIFIRRTTPWTQKGKADSWEPLDLAAVASAPAPYSNPVTDWLDALTNNREPVCSGRNGA